MDASLLKKWVIIILLPAALPAIAQRRSMQQDFATPPGSVKPSVYYYWLSDNISQQGVQKDLESMAKVGIGRAFIGNIGLSKEETAYGKVKLFTDEWWKITALAMKTATKLGIDIGMFNSPGWSQSGGPWITPANTMRYLYSQEWLVKGGHQPQEKFIVTKKDFQPVAVLAFPQPAADNDVIALHQPNISSSTAIPQLSFAADNDTATVALFPENNTDTSTINIDITLSAPFTARSLLLYMAKQPISAFVSLQVNQEGNYQTIKAFELDRSNPAQNVGFAPFAPVAISFNETTAIKFRLIFSHIRGRGGIAEIACRPQPGWNDFPKSNWQKCFKRRCLYGMNTNGHNSRRRVIKALQLTRQR